MSPHVFTGTSGTVVPPPPPSSLLKFGLYALATIVGLIKVLIVVLVFRAATSTFETIVFALLVFIYEELLNERAEADADRTAAQLEQLSNDAKPRAQAIARTSTMVRVVGQASNVLVRIIAIYNLGRELLRGV